MLSKRVSHIKPAPTLALTAKVSQLRNQGVDVIGFGAGEPDFDTPEFIKEACIKALRDGQTKYSPPAGIPPLREALSKKLLEENGVDYKPSEIILTSGAKMALYLVFTAILEEGDEVLLPSPYWVTYPEQILLCGAKPVEIVLKEERQFVLTAEDIKPYITKKTKALVLNSPSNPTGAIVPEEEMRKIAELCLNNNVFLVSDECYEAFVYNDEKFVSPASLVKEVREITFTINAFSKTYSMTGWRIGYVACPEKFAKVVADLNSQTISNATTFAQYGALEALRNPESKKFVETMRQAFQKRRDLAYEQLRSIPKVSVVKPKGAFYIFPNLSFYSDQLGSDLALAEFLLDKGGVAVVPGSAFGRNGYIRISYCVSEDAVKHGIERIERALNLL